jgi:D-alanyl-lipoteichoic acid acyltransferase DltB (MBOAT superfamily)
MQSRLFVFFKYVDFLFDNISAVGGPSLHFGISLPIGISFYTFTQIAYLVDAYRQHSRPYSFERYTFFVTFFPHLIAGPILHHTEIMPQLESRNTFRFDFSKFSLGLAWFSAGMFKKVVLADNLQQRQMQFFPLLQPPTWSARRPGWAP